VSASFFISFNKTATFKTAIQNAVRERWQPWQRFASVLLQFGVCAVPYRSKCSTIASMLKPSLRASAIALAACHAFERSVKAGSIYKFLGYTHVSKGAP
jgi:hypothetical protein